MLYSFKCVCLPDVSYSWLILLGGGGEEEMEHYPTMNVFVCAMSHGYVAEGCTAYLCDVELAIASFAPHLHLLFFLPLLHFLRYLFAPTQLDTMDTVWP